MFFLNTYFEGEWDLTAGQRSFAGHRRACQKNLAGGNHARELHASPDCFEPDPHASCVWACGGLFRLRPPPVSSGADKTSSLLGFSVWYLDLQFLVIFVSDIPLCLGFLRDFLISTFLRYFLALIYFPWLPNE